VYQIPSAFRFLPSDVGSSPCPDWICIQPQTGLLLPGETTSITVSTDIDDASAAQLNLGPSQIELTLILHIAFGKDHFIFVTGDYEYTCFANNISRLVRLPGPIRTLKGPNDLLTESRAINAPREIMRVAHWLMSKSPVDGLFCTPVRDDLVASIRECLDTGADFNFPINDETILAFGEALKQLLKSLTEPVIPPALHARCIEATNRDEAFEVRVYQFDDVNSSSIWCSKIQILDALPSSSVNVWISVTAFLNFISQNDDGEENNRPEHFASIFAPILLADDSTQQYPPTSPLGRRNFLLFFLN
jgi:phosphatidylinositol-bisphosphatase